MNVKASVSVALSLYTLLSRPESTNTMQQSLHTQPQHYYFRTECQELGQSNTYCIDTFKQTHILGNKTNPLYILRGILS